MKKCVSCKSSENKAQEEVVLILIWVCWEIYNQGKPLTDSRNNAMIYYTAVDYQVLWRVVLTS